MKKLLFLPLAVVLLSFQSDTTITPIGIGTVLPGTGIKMLDVVTGAESSLPGYKREKGTLVIFSCNTCPFVIAQESRISFMLKFAVEHNVGAVVVNSNEGARDGDDSQKKMKKYAREHHYSSYLVDANAQLADAFGATRTPEIFLFDKDDKLVYRGAIDDSPKDASAVKTRYLQDAIDALYEGKEITTKTTVSNGCTIKRK